MANSLGRSDHIITISTFAEDIESRVRDVLIPSRLGEFTGFSFKFGQMPCSFLENVIFPILPGGGLQTDWSAQLNEWKFTITSNPGSYRCCIPNSGNLQNITLQQRSTDVLNFKYCTRGFFESGLHFVEIFLPNVPQPIGRLAYEGTVEKGAEIYDCVSSSGFSLSRMTENPAPNITISNASGIQVAIAHATLKETTRYRWGTDVSWDDFEIQFPRLPMESLPITSKTAIFVAFLMWVITYKEKRLRVVVQGLIFRLILIIVVIAFWIIFYFAMG